MASCPRGLYAEQIDAFSRDNALVEKWNLVYQPLIYPLLTIGYSK